jgi:hypothetical protein
VIGHDVQVDVFDARDLSPRERDVLASLLGVATVSADRPPTDLAEVNVVGVCGCGCPSIYFAQDAKGAGVELIAEATVDGTDDAVLLYVNSRGDLDSLEYMWVSDSPPSELPDVSMLRPVAR